jgi:hypothetical protein
MLPRVACALSLAVAAAAQQQIIVQGGGSALQAAIDQASPGDILIVRAANYDLVTVRKGIAILCDPGVGIFNNTMGTAPSIAVRDLPAGEHFQLRGGVLLGNGLNPLNASISSCQGPVLFERVATSAAVLRRTVVQQSQQVAFTGCALERMEVSSSNVALADCTLRGICVDAQIPKDCNALAVVDSRVSVSGGSIRGQNAFFILPPSPAIWLSNGALTIAGDASTLIAGGTGNPAQPAIATTTGSVLIDPAVQITSVGPPVGGGASVRVRATPSVRTASTQSGQVFTARTFSEPGSAVVLLADAPRPPVVTPFGDLWLGVSSLIVDSGLVPPNGERVRSFVLPPLARAEPTILQAAGLLLSGELVIGTPTGIVQN